MFAEDHGWGPPSPTTTIVVIGAGGTVAVAARSTVAPSSILVFIGTVLVALIAANAARLRSREELAASAERQRESLDAEARRLEQRLAHERELADRAEIRDLLDDAVAAYEGFRRGSMQVAESFLRRDSRFRERLERLAELWTHMAQVQSRIELRFAADTEISSTYNALMGKLQAQITGFEAARPGPTEDERGDALTALRVRAELFEAFCAAARREVRPPSTE